jgi:hypothetical protein
MWFARALATAPEPTRAAMLAALGRKGFTSASTSVPGVQAGILS